MAINKNKNITINTTIPFKYYVKKNGNVRVKQVMNISLNLLKYKKISKNEMLKIDTGEIIAVENSDTREQNIKSLKKTINTIIEIVDYNFSCVDKSEILFITLTYAENMTDTKRLYRDIDKFIKKLKYHTKELGNLIYFMTVEPQARGAWHAHMIIQVPGVKNLFIENEQIQKWWSHGYTKTQRPVGIKSLGAYLGYYLTDLIDEKGEKKKGKRLYLYPNNLKIYRCSRNIKKPQYNEAIDSNIINDKQLIYSIAYEYLEYDDINKKLYKKNSTIFAEYENKEKY